MDRLTSLEKRLARIEAADVANAELKQLGHRIVYDRATGWSRNIFGCYCDPSKLDEKGYRVEY